MKKHYQKAIVELVFVSDHELNTDDVREFLQTRQGVLPARFNITSFKSLFDGDAAYEQLKLDETMEWRQSV